jgi:hypothetical protein
MTRARARDRGESIADDGGSDRSALLVPYNGSAVAERALDVAVELGRTG